MCTTSQTSTQDSLCMFFSWFNTDRQNDLGSHMLMMVEQQDGRDMCFILEKTHPLIKTLGKREISYYLALSHHTLIVTVTTIALNKII